MYEQALHLEGSGICGDISQTISRDVPDPSPVLITLCEVLPQLQQAAIEDIEEAAVAIRLDPLPIVMNKVKAEEGSRVRGEGGGGVRGGKAGGRMTNQTRHCGIWPQSRFCSSWLNGACILLYTCGEWKVTAGAQTWPLFLCK